MLPLYFKVHHKKMTNVQSALCNSVVIFHRVAQFITKKPRKMRGFF